MTMFSGRGRTRHSEQRVCPQLSHISMSNANVPKLDREYSIKYGRANTGFISGCTVIELYDYGFSSSKYSSGRGLCRHTFLLLFLLKAQVLISTLPDRFHFSGSLG